MADSRQSIMQALLDQKAGLTIDELSDHLQISRTATQQHVMVLERDGLVTSIQQRSTGGRPSRVYTLTPAGYETFPRHYDLLSQQMLKAAEETFGADGIDALMQRMAAQVEDELAPRIKGATKEERLVAVVELMNELGYKATEGTDGQSIRAVNCIYHHLARETRAVCRFDVELLARLLDTEIDHASCMADGAPACLFRLQKPRPA